MTRSHTSRVEVGEGEVGVVAEGDEEEVVGEEEAKRGEGIGVGEVVEVQLEEVKEVGVEEVEGGSIAPSSWEGFAGSGSR